MTAVPIPEETQGAAPIRAGTIRAFQRHPTWAVFAAALVVCSAALALMPESLRLNEASDYRDFYEPVARSLLRGDGVITLRGAPRLSYPPGYPALLAAVFGACHAVQVPESVGLDALAVLGTSLAGAILFALSASVWGARLAVVTAAAWLTYPFTFWLLKQPNVEVPFLVVLYAAILQHWTALQSERVPYRRLLVVGILVGAAMMLRPVAIALVFVLSLVWVVSRPKRARYAFVMLIGTAGVVVPWEIAVYRATGLVIPLSTAGTTSMRDGLTFGIGAKSYRAVSGGLPDGVEALMQEVDDALPAVPTTAQIAAALRQEMSKRPGALIELFAIKAARSWYATDAQRHEAIVLAIQSAYLFLGLLGAIVAWRLGGRTRLLLGLVAAVGLYFWGMTVLVLSIVRYTLPVMGLLFVLLPGLVMVAAAGRASRGGEGVGDRGSQRGAALR